MMVCIREATKISKLIPLTEMPKILQFLQFQNQIIGKESTMSIAEMVKTSPTLECFRCSTTMHAADARQWS
jgi:hypothetical protein